MSGRIDQETVDRAYSCEVPFLLKPFDFDALFGLVEETLTLRCTAHDRIASPIPLNAREPLETEALA